MKRFAYALEKKSTYVADVGALMDHFSTSNGVATRRPDSPKTRRCLSQQPPKHGSHRRPCGYLQRFNPRTMVTGEFYQPTPSALYSDH